MVDSIDRPGQSESRSTRRVRRVVAGARQVLTLPLGRIGLPALLLLVVLSACAPVRLPPPSSLDSIIIDMPHGWWRLHVFPDGSAGYSFGALPEVGQVAQDTFDFEALYLELSARVMAQREPTETYGTVQFCVEGDGCGDLLYFYDQAYAEALFDEAFANRTGQSLLGGPGGPENIDRLWRERGVE